MIARVVGGLGQLVDGDLGAWEVRVTEAEVHDIATSSTGLDLEAIDDREYVRGQPLGATEVHDQTLLPARPCAPFRPAT